MKQRDYDLMLVEAQVENLKLYQEWRDELAGVIDAKLQSKVGRQLGQDSGNVREPTELPGADEGQPGNIGAAAGNDDQHSELLR